MAPQRMKLVGVCLARNESWVLGASLRAALRWCDMVVVVDHASNDGTLQIIQQVQRENPWRVEYSRWSARKTIQYFDQRDGKMMDAEVDDHDAPWAEMDARQHSLALARKFGATHVAIIDADEILTANLTSVVRQWFSWLSPGQCLEVPMLAMRSLDQYQDDDAVWSRAMLTLGFMDDRAVPLTWKPTVDGYVFHHRAPYGSTKDPYRASENKHLGGVMHLQFAHQERLLWKHRWYKMQEVIRWPGREPVEVVDSRYSEAIKAPGNLSPAPLEWWKGIRKDLINLEQTPWHRRACERLWREHGADKFIGLDLFGWPPAKEVVAK